MNNEFNIKNLKRNADKFHDKKGLWYHIEAIEKYLWEASLRGEYKKRISIQCEIDDFETAIQICENMNGLIEKIKENEKMIEQLYQLKCKFEIE